MKKWTKQDLTKIVSDYQDLELAAEQLATDYCAGNGMRVKNIEITGLEYDGNEGYIYFTRTCSRSDYRGRGIGFPNSGWSETEKHDHTMPIDSLIKLDTKKKTTEKEDTMTVKQLDHLNMSVEDLSGTTSFLIMEHLFIYPILLFLSLLAPKGDYAGAERDTAYAAAAPGLAVIAIATFNLLLWAGLIALAVLGYWYLSLAIFLILYLLGRRLA